MRTVLPLLAAAALAPAVIRENPGSKEPLPHDKYLRVVNERDSPVERLYIKTRDGLYVAAALRKPKGNGPFPALIHFHGAPGGRGMEQLAGWSLGTTGGPMWERFLQEGFVVVVADYRGGPRSFGPISKDEVTYADDGLAVVDFVRGLAYVDRNRITLYGVSLGGSVVLHVLARTTVHSAILGAPAPMAFLGVPPAPPGTPAAERFKNMRLDPEVTRRNIAPVQTPILILVGTADSLLAINRPLHDELEKAGKPVWMEIYENGYHDFVVGPQGHTGRSEPLLDSTLDALEKSLRFARQGKL